MTTPTEQEWPTQDQMKNKVAVFFDPKTVQNLLIKALAQPDSKTAQSARQFIARMHEIKQHYGHHVTFHMASSFDDDTVERQSQRAGAFLSQDGKPPLLSKPVSRDTIAKLNGDRKLIGKSNPVYWETLLSAGYMSPEARPGAHVVFEPLVILYLDNKQDAIGAQNMAAAEKMGCTVISARNLVQAGKSIVRRVKQAVTAKPDTKKKRPAAQEKRISGTPWLKPR